MYCRPRYALNLGVLLVMQITHTYKLYQELVRLFSDLVIMKFPDGNFEASNSTGLPPIVKTDFKRNIIYVSNESIGRTLEASANFRDFGYNVVVDLL